MKIVAARFTGRCRHCGAAIQRGDPLGEVRLIGYVCLSCARAEHARVQAILATTVRAVVGVTYDAGVIRTEQLMADGTVVSTVRRNPQYRGPLGPEAKALAEKCSS